MFDLYGMQTLLDTLKTTLEKNKVEKLSAIAADASFGVKDLIDMSFNGDEQIGFRAAWILEKIYVSDENRFLEHAAYFLEKLPLLHNFSALRHFVKILAFITGKKASEANKQFINGVDTEPLIEVVFNWLIDPNAPVAVKAHALQVLANFSIKYPWVRDELLQTMDFLTDRESVAFFARAKQIRKQLGVKG